MQVRSSELKNQHAIVTGGGRGIGGAVAEAFASAGAKLTLIGRSESTLIAKKAQLEKDFGAEVFATSADVSDEAQVQIAFEASFAELGTPSILVANAGMVETAPFAKSTTEMFDRIIAVNLRGAFLSARAVVERMIDANYGRIVFIASTAALTGYPYVSLYCASKHAVVGLAKSLALETARTGVTVNCVCPGYTETDLLTNSAAVAAKASGKSEDEVRKMFLMNVPQQRFIQPEEVASAVLWLCDPAQKSITGQTIPVSAGELF
ncbi:MAG: SDR family oxidoreductase [Planctomycetes bacterium]|nr:SDR family oxidoreductase [Planctomycetota bacterium]